MNRKTTASELGIFVWIDQPAGGTAPLYSVSRAEKGVCVDLPLDEALACIREELEAESRVRLRIAA